METTLWKTYRPVINLVHILSMMRKYGSKARGTMNTYRNKHFESIALNPGDGVYKAENFVFSQLSLFSVLVAFTSFCMEITQTDQPGSGVHK